MRREIQITNNLTTPKHDMWLVNLISDLKEFSESNGLVSTSAALHKAQQSALAELDLDGKSKLRINNSDLS